MTQECSGSVGHDEVADKTPHEITIIWAIQAITTMTQECSGSVGHDEVADDATQELAEVHEA
eukprot:CAMPEP_0206245668 /NCGR_PEP_ID=MMETSP0047_2-20121206/18822_1 /ASSEMBLY_ACC=CAM_ASM_000192 /TAXON_ID=195065 /ORGANISM="Chroomonas mesostigmatica_cf, Strain CCMP1168" /LENGTH=61 /DNA_ID=CAMNT_0053670987 /DNA_START=81 /DNA_END=266 /DNA_ORIENTATION=-